MDSKIMIRDISLDPDLSTKEISLLCTKYRYWRYISKVIFRHFGDIILSEVFLILIILNGIKNHLKRYISKPLLFNNWDKSHRYTIGTLEIYLICSELHHRRHISRILHLSIRDISERPFIGMGDMSQWGEVWGYEIYLTGIEI